MSMHRLGRRNHHFVCVGPEDIGDSGAFGFVIGGGACAVRIDIADLPGVYPGVAQRTCHRSRRALLRGHHDVRCIRGHGKSDNLAKDVRAARFRMFIFFKDKDPGALSLHHAIAIGREWPTRVAGHDAQALPGLYAAKAKHGFRAAGYHHLCCTVSDKPKCLSHCMVG